MDRSTEIKNEYDQMLGLVEKFKVRQTLKVEPKPNHRWYLFEKEGYDSWVDDFDSEMAAYMKEHWGEKKGWTITPVDIFRTS